MATDSPGRSGARMLMSHDKRYFIKTLVQEEVEQMHHLLKQYHQVSKLHVLLALSNRALGLDSRARH